MKKRITQDTCNHGFEINQIVKVDRVDSNGDFWSDDQWFDTDNCEDFDDYRPGDKVRVKQDTLSHRLRWKLVTIKRLRNGVFEDGTRSYDEEGGMIVPERDFDCYEGEPKTMGGAVKMKFGDKVKVTGRSHYHKFNIGEIVTCVEEPKGDYYGIHKNKDGLTQHLSPNDYEIIKETKTMLKFEVGDKVRIVGCSNHHRFKLGEVIRIVELYPDGNSPHYCQPQLFMTMNLGRIYQVTKILKVKSMMSAFIEHTWRVYNFQILPKIKGDNKMKKFCGCNSIWEDELSWLEENHVDINCDKVCRLVLPGIYTSIDGQESCQYCNNYFWYDADYENMMFDLRRMNR